MKKLVLFMTLFIFVTCSPKYYERLYRSTFTVQDIVKINEAILKSENPAEKILLERQLEDGLVSLKNVKVRSVAESQNIDYSVVVFVEVETEMGMVELLVFSKSLSMIAKLRNNESRINVLGDFGRMYKLFDDVYLRVEVMNSDITVLK